MLKYKITSAVYEKLKDGLKALYSEKGDGYALDVTGAVDKDRLDEFRTSAVDSKKALDTLKGQLGDDFDPKKYAALIAQAEEIEKKKLIQSGDVDKLVEKALEKAQTAHKAQMDGMNTKLSAVGTQLSAIVVDKALMEAAVSAGVSKGALTDAVARGKGVYKLSEDGKVKPVDSEGQPLLAEDGAIQTMKGFFEGLAKTAGHLFETNVGGGGQGPGVAVVGDGKQSSIDKIQAGLDARK